MELGLVSLTREEPLNIMCLSFQWSLKPMCARKPPLVPWGPVPLAGMSFRLHASTALLPFVIMSLWLVMEELSVVCWLRTFNFGVREQHPSPCPSAASPVILGELLFSLWLDFSISKSHNVKKSKWDEYSQVQWLVMCEWHMVVKWPKADAAEASHPLGIAGGTLSPVSGLLPARGLLFHSLGVLQPTSLWLGAMHYLPRPLGGRRAIPTLSFGTGSLWGEGAVLWWKKLIVPVKILAWHGLLSASVWRGRGQRSLWGEV